MKAEFGKRAEGAFRGTGYAFFIITVALFGSALNTGANLLYIVLGGLVSFLVLSFVLSRTSLAKLAVSRDAPRAVHRGQTFITQVRIENRKRWFPSISIRIESDGEPGVSKGYMMQVPPQRAGVLNVRQNLPTRGVHELPAINLVSGYPFGLLERRRTYEDQREVVVYPRVHTVRTAMVEQMQGGQAAARATTDEGDDFYDLREYTVGDDFRKIAWRVSARVGEWMVREMAQQKTRAVIIALEGRLPKELEPFDRVAEREQYAEHYEDAVDVAASLGVSLMHRGYEIALIAPDAEVAMGKGTPHERRLLNALARVQLTEEVTHAGFAHLMGSQDLRVASMVYIAPDPTWWCGDGVPGRALVLDPREILHG